jgi:DNA-binding response OmpR family regulator
MLQKPKILFIDDDESTRRIFTTKLIMSGFQPYVVASAEAAVEVLEKEKIQLIITDLMMPGYNGVDLIRAVRDCPTTKNIPIIVLTTGGDVRLMDEAGIAGANEIFSKLTCPPTQLVARINELLKAAETPPPQAQDS